MQTQAVSSQHRCRERRLLAAVAAIGALSAVSTTTSVDVRDVAASTEPASRQTETRIYTLPEEAEVFPEGVAIEGDTYYVTGAGSETIYRGDLDEPVAEELAADRGWGPMLGIEVVGPRLLVARGLGGNVSLHDRTTGAVVARWTNNVWPDPTLINDIAIAPNGDAYITDSERPVLYRIPAAELRNPSAGPQDLRVFLQWDDPPYSNYVPEVLEANGIVATPDGKFLLIVHYTDGFLFRVRLADKHVTRVKLGSYRLISGDGMVLTDDRVLYVVRPFGSLVAKLRLDAHYTRGRLLSETGDRNFQSPTTAAIAGERLLVVNSQFGGPGTPPWTVSSIRLP
jgi:Cu-Zn family superoxide dismutase